MALFKLKNTIQTKALKSRFTTNPFSILRADSQEWISKKREWETIIRDRENNVRDTTVRNNTPYINNFAKEDFKGAKSPNAGMTSVFDPFLCEILVKWFSKEGDTILDFCAGGLVRGAVASILNRRYVGIDISPKQIEHNEAQWQSILERYSNTDLQAPKYILGDSNAVLDTLDASYDMVLTCPPYYNLERYTDDKDDLSNLRTYEEFRNRYASILTKASQKLKQGGFFVIVVEEIRDKNGAFYGFVPDTIKILQESGLSYYNEMILMNPIASLGIRCTKYFEASRKVGRHHQNILVFRK